MLQNVEAVCRSIVEQAAAAAEAAQKDCAAWKAKYEAALDRCNQQEFKVSMTTSCHCIDSSEEDCLVPAAATPLLLGILMLAMLPASSRQST